jgi:glycosyltransferase involved in cell wall biosynthesis
MACGAPCVISDLPWVHEQIADEREALVVPIDRDGVAGAIRRLADDHELAAGIAARGRSLVERHHDAAAHMDRLAETYRALVRPR